MPYSHVYGLAYDGFMYVEYHNVSAVHIPGKHNVIFDGLSRKEDGSMAGQKQTKVPSKLLPWCLSQLAWFPSPWLLLQAKSIWQLFTN